MSLRERLAEQIRQHGPMTVAQYMTACLHDPLDGYYAARPALGAEGDFVTAPLVSQMFGELLGLWLVEAWTRLGRPAPFRLVEMGPGDGTLMSDVLRAARLSPAFLQAADLWLVEVSAPLKALQAERLGPCMLTPRWAARLEDVPGEAPLLLLANELLDCLPARQFVRTDKGWAERLVGLDDAGALAFGLAKTAAGVALPEAPVGAVVEHSPAQEAVGQIVGERIARDGGAALLIDYGRDVPGAGDTLQALRGHQKVDPLACPGEADLTVHADFPAILAAAQREGARAGPIRSQRHLLLSLGLAERAQALAEARPDRADQIERQFDRLVGEDQMGLLFKAACLHQPGFVAPGFEP
jgi:NADH dehydrogenase [ubiquinone] 1 alpha subcomplex assembly factor 7